MSICESAPIACRVTHQYPDTPISGHTNFRTLVSPKRKKLWSSFLYQMIAHCMTDLQPENELQ